MFSEEGADGVCPYRLREDSGVCSSAAVPPSRTSHWWSSCPHCLSNQRTCRASLYLLLIT